MKTMKMAVALSLFAFAVESMAQTSNATVVQTYKRAGVTGANASAGVWGYVGTDGKEYALLTNRNPGGVEAVEFTATSVRSRGFVTSPNSIWQEVNSYRTTAYKVSQEGSSGLQIINMAPLNSGGNITQVRTMPMNGYNVAHTVYVDTTANPARLYATYGGANGVVFYSLANPEQPTQIGIIPGEAHDIFAKNNRLYISTQRRGTLEIWNVSNPGSPSRVSTINVRDQSRTLGEIGASSNTITHNSWISEDNKTLFTTEEISGTTLKSWNLTNEASPTYISRIRVAGNIIPHNCYVKGNYVFIGHYTAGLRVINVSNPAAMTEVAYHDGSSSNAPYGGSWGVYPWYPSGLVIHGDDVAGLYVVRLNTVGIEAASRKAAGLQFNMAAGALQFKLPGSGDFALSLLNLQGREVYGFRGQGEGLQTLSLDKGLSAGNYLVRLKQGSAEHTAPVALRN